MAQKWRYEFNEILFPNQQKAYDLLPKVFCKPSKHSWIKIPNPSKEHSGAEICGKCKLYRRPKKTTKKTRKKKTEKKNKGNGSELGKTFKWFWRLARENLTVKTAFIGVVGLILLIELIKGLFF